MEKPNAVLEALTESIRNFLKGESFSRSSAEAILKDYPHLILIPAPQPNAGLREAIRDTLSNGLSWGTSIDDVADRILSLLPLGSEGAGEDEAERGVLNAALGLYANRGNENDILTYLMPKLWFAVENLKKTKGLPIFPITGEEAEIQKDETLNPRYGNPLNFTLSNKPGQMEIDGIKHQVPLDVWRVLGQVLHLSVERQRKINALIQERHISPGVSIPALLEVYQNAVRHALRVLDDDDATKAQQVMATGAEVQACQDILDVLNNLTRRVTGRKLDE